MDDLKSFVIKLYANEKFPIYLGIVIAVLVVLFFVILFLGKKDQKKLEKTLKLEKVEDNLFKDQVKPTKVEVPIVQNNKTPVVNNVNQNEIKENILVENKTKIKEEIKQVETKIESPITQVENTTFVENEVIQKEPIIPQKIVDPIVNNNPISSKPVINEIPVMTPVDNVVNELPPLEPINDEDTYQAIKPNENKPENSVILEKSVTPTVKEEPAIPKEPVIPVLVKPEEIKKEEVKNENQGFKSMLSTFEERIRELEEEEKQMKAKEETKVEPQIQNEEKPKETKVLNVFSSVYTPPVDDGIEMLDMPKLKE